jgi:hypothetical protein
VTGRAVTPEAKRAIIERLLAAWLASPHLRLGQLLEGRMHRQGVGDMFYVEDDVLARVAEGGQL